MTERLVEYVQKDEEKKQAAVWQGKETIMRKAIDKIKRIFTAMARAYKEAAPYMNISRYDCPNLQIAY